MASAQSRRWCFTAQNPTAEDRDLLAALDCVYIVYGDEVAPTTGTIHLQGFVVFQHSTRRNTLVNRGFNYHWEVARGTSQQASTYCKKDGVFTERGVLPLNSGKRTDLERVLEWADEFILDNGRAPSDREVAAAHPLTLIRYRNFVEVLRLRAPIPILREGEPREWQRELSNELDQPADDRTVLFYVDLEGGTGKTWFQQWYMAKHPDEVQIVGVGRVVDVAHAIEANKSVFLFNVPRDGMQFFQYSICEQLKDRMVFSTKYNSTLKIINKQPHVVVFCNEAPDMEKMSADRYAIRGEW